jgi:hypothetical protein
MERAYKTFLEVGKTKELFSLDDPAQPKVFVISAHSLQHAVFRFLVKDVEGTSKKNTCKMNEEEMNDKWTLPSRRIRILKMPSGVEEYFFIPRCLVSQYHKLSNCNTLDVDRDSRKKQNVLHL